jgi:hypothetical protein
MKIISLNKIPKYTHLSNKKIKLLINKIQSNGYKPNGFYFSYKTEWLKHILNKDKIDDINIKIPNNMYIYQVNFDKYNIYKLNSYEKIIKFTNKYLINNNNKFYTIDWIKISNKYDGIIISNYKSIIKKLKFLIKKYNYDLKKILWFFMFDVNGGCIWNTNIIKLDLLL